MHKIKPLFAAMLLSGCASQPMIDTTELYTPNPKLTAVLAQEPIGQNAYTVTQCQRMRYEPEAVDGWTPPAEFIKRGYGDCDDFAMCIFYALHEEQPLLIASDDHIWVESNGNAYESTGVYPASSHRIGHGAKYALTEKYTMGLK